MESTGSRIVSQKYDVCFPLRPGIYISHLVAYHNTGPERDLGHGSLLMGTTGWKKMTAMKNIRSKLTATNFFCDQNNRVLKNTMPFASLLRVIL